MLLSVLAFLRYLGPERRKRYLYISAIAAGLACLTFGWFTVVRGLWNSRFPIMRAAGPGLMAAVITIQAGSAISTYPYYLTYYNPLMGGAAGASEVTMIGWGVGLDRIAEYLNEQPDAEQLTVVTISWAVTLACLFDGSTKAARFVRNEESLQQWQDAGFYVLYINQLQQERIPSQLRTYFSGLTPELTFQLEGLEYAWL